MTKFYTNVQSFGNSILYRGIENGEPVRERVEYSPSYYVPARKQGQYQFKSLDGVELQQKRFNSINEAREFVKQFKDVPGAPVIYGQNRFEYAFIADEHRGMVDYEFDKVSVAVIDIEVGSENGFPDPYEANEPITAICVRYLNGPTYVFGCGDYETQGKEYYIKCKDEWTLCKRFIELWSKKCPDIITGWNTKFFDIPYLVNRFNKILGDKETKKLSPWNHIGEREEFTNNRKLIAYTLTGVASLDYIELYKGMLLVESRKSLIV